MAIHSFNPNRARQLAAIHAKDRASGEFHHLRIHPAQNGYVVTAHHRLGTHYQPSQFKTRELLPASAPDEDFPRTQLHTTHVLPNLDALHDHLDDVLGANVVHRPVGQHLAVHIPQRGTQNDEPIEDV